MSKTLEASMLSRCVSMPKLNDDQALRVTWLAELQAWDRKLDFLYRTNAPDDVWDDAMRDEPSNNFEEWKARRAKR